MTTSLMALLITLLVVNLIGAAMFSGVACDGQTFRLGAASKRSGRVE